MVKLVNQDRSNQHRPRSGQTGQKAVCIQR
jgi:hypothetical protein